MKKFLLDEVLLPLSAILAGLLAGWGLICLLRW